MEIYTLTIELLAGRFYSPWKRIVEMRADTELYEIHDFIQRTIEFEEDHLYEFYTGRNYRNRERVFMEDYERSWEPEHESSETTLEQIYPLGRSKLYYLFDFGDSWLFEFRRANKKKQAEPGVEYPRVIEAEGENPKQYGWDEDDDEDDDE